MILKLQLIKLSAKHIPETFVVFILKILCAHTFFVYLPINQTVNDELYTKNVARRRIK